MLAFIAPSLRLVGCPHVVACGISSLTAYPISSRCLFAYSVSPRERLVCASRLFFPLCVSLPYLLITRLVSHCLVSHPHLPHAIAFSPAPAVSSFASHTAPMLIPCVSYENTIRPPSVITNEKPTGELSWEKRRIRI